VTSAGLCSRDAAAKPYMDVFTGVLQKSLVTPEQTHGIETTTRQAKSECIAYELDCDVQVVK